MSYEDRNWPYRAITVTGEHHSDWHTDEFDGCLLPTEEFQYGEYHVDIAELGFKMLEALCTDIRVTGRHPERLDWLDRDALHSLVQIDALARAGFLVPPEKAGNEERHRFTDSLHALRTALPWSEGERRWLVGDAYFDASVNSCDAEDRNATFFANVADRREHLASEGKLTTVVGSELLERFRQWRREEGDYADGVGLERARTALASIITLLRPSIGLPAEFEETRPTLTFQASD